MKNDNGKDDFSRLLVNDSLLPDIFLVRYAHNLSKNALLLYLWLNMTGDKKGFDESVIKKYKIIPDEDIDKAIAELMSAGLVDRKDKIFIFDDLKAREVEEYVQAQKARITDPDAVLSSDEKERNTLAESISKTFYLGKLPYIFYRLIDKCLYEYKFEGMVVYKLFEEGYEQNIYRSNILMENKALEWYQKGYTDSKSLEKHLEISSRTTKLVKLCGKILRRRLNELDIERVSKWAEDLDATEELVTLAFRENEFRSNITLKNVGDTLTKWHDQGIKTADEAVRFCEEEHKENKRKASRKKSNTGSSWRTGAEAGIGEDPKPKAAQEPKEEAKDTKDTQEDDIPDDILDMFGDSDEDN